jgi:hypothetical protein
MQTNTASFLSASSLEFSASSKKVSQSAKETRFDGVLSSAQSDMNTKDFAVRMLEKISLTISQNLSSIGKSGAAKNTFPLSGSFEATFGSHGPLIDFINGVTVKLGLSAQQNSALQAIAVNNKDATRSPESIAKIAAELRQAGITA